MSDLAPITDDETVPVTDDNSGIGEPVVSEEPSSLDLDQYGSYLVPISVDGVEERVSLSDLRGGYMRHADYTRGSQELAAQREQVASSRALQEALDEDPGKTLAILQAVYGGDNAAGVAEIEDELLDPMERRLAEVEKRFEVEDSETQQRQLREELDGLNAKYGVDQKELLTFAMDNQIGRLDQAYDMYVGAQQRAKADAEAAVAAADEARTAEKRDASFVSGGTTTTSSSAAVPQGTMRSFRDSFADAKASLGL